MKSYSSYKDSGVEWIGEIPSGWDIKRIGFFFDERRIKVDDTTYPPLSVTMKGIKDQLEGVAKSDDTSNRKLVKKNDFVINSRSDRKGSSGVSFRDGSVSLINTVLEPRNIHPNYVGYLLKNYYFIEEYFRNGKGIHFDLWSTNYSLMKNIKIPVVNIQEQQQISNYLDHKTRQIDTLIEKTQQKIELLKEQRTSLINRIVTKGLNPNVEMKDSGVEWIGDIPSGWGMVPIKYLVSTKITDGPHETPKFVDDGIPFLSVESVQNNKLDFNKKRGFITDELHEEYSKKCKPQRDDVFLVKSGSTTGKSTIVETDIEFNIWSPLCIIRSNQSKVTPKFTRISLQSDYFRKFIELGWSFGTQPNIGMGVVENIRLIIPPLNEQQQIVDYLDQETTKIDTLIEKENQRIDLLKEYRQSLISEVVTGKVDVRDEVFV